ncbi:Ku protein [Streptomyces sparsogenes]|uniref:non-homologous end joining protein Ku n=1 Tax=Streptomyces sparsogenes TaxID=67365 RepID=UPI0033CB0E77
MARAIWSGVLTFGLVTVPVQMFTATEDHTVHFHQLQRGTSDRVRYQRVNGRTGKEVDHDDIVKGYDLGGGDYVIVEPDELDEIAPGKSQVIEITGFADLEQVDPVYFDKTYYLAPKGEEYTKVYELLRAALEKENKTGIATFVMRGKQYLVALRAQEQVLVLHTLHWADEVRDPHQELPVLPSRGDAQGKELDTARQLIGTLSVDWNPKDYRDTYEERVKELVDSKAKGKEIVSEEAPPEATNVIDLMEALQRSVEQTRGSGGKAPGELRGQRRSHWTAGRSSRVRGPGEAAIAARRPRSDG